VKQKRWQSYKMFSNYPKRKEQSLSTKIKSSDFKT
jgi:hypothetical protein